MEKKESLESPLGPLARTMNGRTIHFDTAVVTLEGLLPAWFAGPVGKSVQDLFRPLQIVLDRGPMAGPKPPYCILLGGTRYRVDSDLARAFPILETSALTVGGFVAVWLENFGAEPAPFRVRLLGHSGRPHPGGNDPPSDEEVGSSSVWLGMVAADVAKESLQ